MDQRLVFKGNTIVNGDAGGGGVIQQPAEAIVTGSVSLPLSTPEYSGKARQTDGRKDREIRAFTLDLEQANMGPRERSPP